MIILDDNDTSRATDVTNLLQHMDMQTPRMKTIRVPAMSEKTQETEDGNSS